jgi:integrase
MLTELMIKQLIPREKSYALQDGQGLMLDVRPNGKKYWIVRYWVGGKEKRTSVGPHPQVSLREARMKNMEIRKSLKSEKPLGFDRETFAAVAEEWVERRMVPTSAESYLRTIRIRLEKYILPSLGHMKISKITSGAILQLCRKIEDKDFIETASRVKTVIGQICRYGIATGRLDTDPTLALQGAMKTRKEKHYAAITEPDKIAIFMRQIEAYPYDVVRLALKFSALTFSRPGEIRQAEWIEINWDSAEWQSPAARMKNKQMRDTEQPHIVPLARQTIDVLRDLHVFTGKGKWLFPSARHDGRCMSDNTVRIAIRSMGYGNEDMTSHGFRAMASTILNGSRLNDGRRLFAPDIIERQLSHVEKNKVRAAYNHAEYLPERQEMMQWWADYLEGLSAPK